MTDFTQNTKAQLVALLTAASVALPRKANHTTLVALAVQHLTPAPAALPHTNKPVQVAVGLKIEKDRPEQNGVKRPSLGGRCRAVWDALSAYQNETGMAPNAQVVRDLAADEGWNPNNASIEFYQWRKYHGIKGRTPKVAVAATEAE